ncbi:MAG: hypothetical protein OXL37_10940 [Chloroflexota bacterium]|nr:hypothetical protein [Chloroflexota bacterium]MDE2959472.1 hypothetical protein [Chloroflexota bacterium]
MEYKGRKYRKLYAHLRSLSSQEWKASFDDIEAIIGDRLPASARRHRASWANDITQARARAWLAAGWETADVDMDAETLLFRRKRPLLASRRNLDEIWPARSFGPWPEGLSLRREDLYREWERVSDVY